MKKTKVNLSKQQKKAKTTEYLKTNLTIEEVTEASQKMAENLQSLDLLRDEKKAIVSSYNSRIDEAQKELSRLGGLVRDKYEYRDIECDVIFNTPKDGTKVIIRTDSFETVRTESMTDYERQENLFEKESK